MIRALLKRLFGKPRSYEVLTARPKVRKAGASLQGAGEVRLNSPSVDFSGDLTLPDWQQEPTWTGGREDTATKSLRSARTELKL